MKRFSILFTLIFAILTQNDANSATFNIDMLNKRDDGEKMVFSEDVQYVEIGDTVNWLPTSPGHNVEFISAPANADLPKKPSKVNKEFSYNFNEPGIYLYQCSPHKSMGMIALVVVGNDLSNKDMIASTRVVGKSKKKLESLLSTL
tara:strand:+ start:334 stop:771 length:438 start_codon:yes stop_codon:yes gene_type:complete